MKRIFAAISMLVVLSLFPGRGWSAQPTPVPKSAAKSMSHKKPGTKMRKVKTAKAGTIPIPAASPTPMVVAKKHWWQLW